MKKKNVIMGLDMRNKYIFSTECEGVSLMNDDKMVKISEMPFGKKFEDYPEDTVFIWDEEDEDSWEDELED